MNRIARSLPLIVAALLLFVAVFSCQAPDGTKQAPFTAIATFGSVADARSNLNVTLVKTDVDGVVGIRDNYLGGWLMPPKFVKAGTVVVYRHDPKFDETYAPDEPLPYWLSQVQGLFGPGEADSLGYFFEPDPATEPQL